MLNFKSSDKELEYIDENKFRYHGKEEGTWSLTSDNELQIADMYIAIQQRNNYFRYETNLKSMKKYFSKSSFNNFMTVLNYDYNVPLKFHEYPSYVEREKKLFGMLSSVNDCKVYSSSKNIYIEIIYPEYCLEIEMVREKSKLTTTVKTSGDIVYEGISEIDNPRNMISRYYASWRNMVKQNRIQMPTDKMIRVAKGEKITVPGMKDLVKIIYKWADFVNEEDFLRDVSSAYRFSDFLPMDLLLIRKNRILFDDPELEYITPAKFKYTNKQTGTWSIMEDKSLKIGEMVLSFEEITMSVPLVRFEIKNWNENKYFSEGGLGKFLMELRCRYGINMQYTLYENFKKEKKLIEYLISNQCTETVKGLYINDDSFNVKFDTFDIEIHQGLPILRRNGLICNNQEERKLIDLLLNYSIN